MIDPTRLGIFRDLCEENGFLDIFDELSIYNKFFELVERFQRLAKTEEDYIINFQIKVDDPKYILEIGPWYSVSRSIVTVIEDCNTLKELIEDFEKTIIEAEVAVTLYKGGV